jgi:hypothetical protein
VGVLVTDFQTIANDPDCLLKVSGELEAQIVGMAELLGLIDATCLAWLVKHLLQHGVQVTTPRHLNTMQEANLDVRVPGEQPANGGSFRRKLLEGRKYIFWHMKSCCPIFHLNYLPQANIGPHLVYDAR